MRIRDAHAWVGKLRRAGLPYLENLTEYYKRFFFALVPFVVVLISCSVGGRLKKNVLLMNLLFSLVLTVVYYVTDMVTVILAKNGMIPPLLGASGGTLLLLATGAVALKNVRT